MLEANAIILNESKTMFNLNYSSDGSTHEMMASATKMVDNNRITSHVSFGTALVLTSIAGCSFLFFIKLM